MPETLEVINISRPIKCRKVCSLPKNSGFCPIGRKLDEHEAVIMKVDEYETIRLIDYQGFTQEECGQHMKIARATVQQIYNNTRKKLAQALVEGRPLFIEGGDYHICDGMEQSCDCGGCDNHSNRKK